MTVVFAVYAVAALAALLTVGSLSDFVGRRPVLLAAIAVQAASMVVFATADGVTSLLVARVVQAAGVAVMPESAEAKPGALASLRPQIGIPAAARRPLLLTGPALIAVWALAGFYLSLGPALARLLAGSHSLVLGGMTVFAFAASAGVTVLFVQTASPRNVLYLGTAALATGVGITLAATSVTSIAALYLGTVVAGVGIGSGFQGVLRTLLPLVAPHERAGVLSTIYVTLYLAMGLPAVIGGFLVVHGGC